MSASWREYNLDSACVALTSEIAIARQLHRALTDVDSEWRDKVSIHQAMRIQ